MVGSLAKRPMVIEKEKQGLDREMKAFTQAIPNPRRGKKQKI